jgi:ribosome-associated protein YbcJ (S4-like RNA binding protein)
VNPGKYIMYEVTRSGSGNIYINVKEVEVKADGNIEKLKEWELFRGDTISMLPDQLPSEIMTLLLNNQKELPLFSEYMKQVKYLQG